MYALRTKYMLIMYARDLDNSPKTDVSLGRDITLPLPRERFESTQKS